MTTEKLIKKQYDQGIQDRRLKELQGTALTYGNTDATQTRVGPDGINRGFGYCGAGGGGCGRSASGDGGVVP